MLCVVPRCDCVSRCTACGRVWKDGKKGCLFFGAVNLDSWNIVSLCKYYIMLPFQINYSYAHTSTHLAAPMRPAALLTPAEHPAPSLQSQKQATSPSYTHKKITAFTIALDNRVRRFKNRSATCKHWHGGHDQITAKPGRLTRPSDGISWWGSDGLDGEYKQSWDSLLLRYACI